MNTTTEQIAQSTGLAAGVLASPFYCTILIRFREALSVFIFTFLTMLLYVNQTNKE